MQGASLNRLHGALRKRLKFSYRRPLPRLDDDSDLRCIHAPLLSHVRAHKRNGPGKNPGRSREEMIGRLRDQTNHQAPFSLFSFSVFHGPMCFFLTLNV